MRAPKKTAAELSEELAEQLAEERSMKEQLASELEQSRKENEELRLNMNAKDTGSNPDSQNLDFEVQARLSSTRQHAMNSNVSRSFEESRFLSSVNQLSVASINVPECKGTDNEPIHRQTFELWKDLLVDSLKLAGIDEEATMYTVFKVKAGPRLLDIFRNTKTQADAPDPDTAPFSNAMHRLKTYFGSGSDVMLMRRRLALMVQKGNETDLNYIVRVGSTARLCEFENDKEFEEIVSTVAEHARSRDVRTAALKMISRQGSFTDLVDKVRELEAIQLNEDYVKQKHGRERENLAPALVAPVRSPQVWEAPRFPRGNMNFRGYPGRRGSWRAPRGRYPSANVQSRPQNQPLAGERCWRCYSVYHTGDICNVKDKTCHKCGLVGHIQRACTPSTYKRTAKEGLEAAPAKIAVIEKVEEVAGGDDSVSAAKGE